LSEINALSMSLIIPS